MCCAVHVLCLQEDDVEQELLLDGCVPPVGSGHGGAQIELPLSYNLTGHTGSFMYMAPEVYNVSPGRLSCTLLPGSLTHDVCGAPCTMLLRPGGE
jgi:hypothetical protein